MNEQVSDTGSGEPLVFLYRFYANSLNFSQKGHIYVISTTIALSHVGR